MKKKELKTKYLELMEKYTKMMERMDEKENTFTIPDSEFSGYAKFSKRDAEKFMKGVNKKPLYSVVNFSTKDNCNAMPWD